MCTTDHLQGRQQSVPFVPTKVLFSDELTICTQKSKFITKKHLNNIEQSKCRIYFFLQRKFSTLRIFSLNSSL